MRFSLVADVLEKLEKTSSHLAMREVLVKFLKKTPTPDVRMVSYLVLGIISADYKRKTLGMASAMVMKSIAKATDTKEAHVKKLFKKKGDLGLVAQDLVGKKGKPLSLKQVYTVLHRIAESTGSKSQVKKQELLGELLSQASPKEAKYIVRMVTGVMRIGASDATLLQALAVVYTGDVKNKKLLEAAYQKAPDVGVVAEMVAKKGLKGLSKVSSISIGRPIASMLSQRVKKFEDLEKKIPGKIVADEKYDGERVQIHRKGEMVVFFSRRMTDITSQFPELVEVVKKQVKADCIIDAEIVPVDKKGKILPFQVLMQRRRKYNVEEYIKKVPVVIYAFDVLQLGGKSLLNIPYLQRRKHLSKIIKKTKKIQLSRQIVSSDLKVIEKFFNDCLTRGTEGIIAKRVDSPYEPGKRGWNWIKWKKDYALGDSFDVVVVGGIKGRGKRSGTYGSLVCATYNKGKFETLCKLGAGFSDKDLKGFLKKFKKRKEQHPKLVIMKELARQVDVWFEPQVVIEVLGAELTRSSLHTCAAKGGKGLSLRFPRFVRYRDDKSVRQATTSREVEGMAKKA